MTIIFLASGRAGANPISEGLPEISRVGLETALSLDDCLGDEEVSIGEEVLLLLLLVLATLLLLLLRIPAALIPR